MSTVSHFDVFLSTPITNVIDPSTGLIEVRMAQRLHIIAESIRRAGHTVFLAAEREDWGAVTFSAQQCAELDYDALNKSEHVVALIGDHMSGGVLIELGWASSLGKSITILVSGRQALSPLVAGLPSICDAHIYCADWESDSEAWRAILETRGISLSAGSVHSNARYDMPGAAVGKV